MAPMNRSPNCADLEPLFFMSGRLDAQDPAFKAAGKERDQDGRFIGPTGEVSIEKPGRDKKSEQ